MTTMKKLVQGMSVAGFVALAMAAQGCAAEADDSTEDDDVGSSADAVTSNCKVVSIKTVRETSEICNPVPKASDSCVWPVGNACYGGKISIVNKTLSCGGTKKIVTQRACING